MSRPHGSNAPFPRESLTGWGRTSPSVSTVVPVDLEQDAATAVLSPPARGLVPRGLGRSYGDAAQNGGGIALDMTRLDRVLAFEPVSGIVEVEAGVSVHTLIERFLPLGWFVPVSPGTRYVSVGGAIAADIHGKNHHRVGSFGQHVRSLDLLTGEGQVRTLSPETTPNEFWATVGGMGLTGAILRATVSLTAVPSSFVSVGTRKADDLDALMALQVDMDADHPYSVAWIDCLSKGAKMGRGVLTVGRFAELNELLPSQSLDPHSVPGEPFVGAPRLIPNGLLNRWSVAAFNELWFRKSPKARDAEIQSMSRFFHPLDGVGAWNRMYGSQGFLQYQFVVPDAHADVVRLAIERLSAIGAASFLAVLKRFGPSSPAHLSFPLAGWTLALDIPSGVADLAPTLDSLDEAIAEAGGRIYLAKDSRMRPQLLPTMYPRLSEWQRIRSVLDPNRTYQSDLARRLSL